MLANRTCIVAVALVAVGACLPAATATTAEAAPPPIAGRWVLDQEASDDPAKALKGLKRLPSRGVPEVSSGGIPGAPRRQTDARAEDYARQIAAANALAEARRAADPGAVRKVLEATALTITALSGDGREGYRFDYGTLDRPVFPNPAGRVFSASGSEVVEDGLGRTVSYWRDGVLMLECRAPDLVRLIESWELGDGGQTLTQQLKIQHPRWKGPGQLRRIYRRAAS